MQDLLLQYHNLREELFRKDKDMKMMATRFGELERELTEAKNFIAFKGIDTMKNLIEKDMLKDTNDWDFVPLMERVKK